MKIAVVFSGPAIVGVFRDEATANLLMSCRSGLTMQTYQLKDRVDQCDKLKKINDLTNYRCRRPLTHDGECEFMQPPKPAPPKVRNRR